MGTYSISFLGKQGSLMSDCERLIGDASMNNLFLLNVSVEEGNRCVGPIDRVDQQCLLPKH